MSVGERDRMIRNNVLLSLIFQIFTNVLGSVGAFESLTVLFKKLQHSLSYTAQGKASLYNFDLSDPNGKA